MTSDFLTNFIQDKCLDADIIVLKGYEPRLLLELSKTYPLLDPYVVKQDKLCLDEVSGKRFLLSVMSAPSGQKSICTCESLISMCTEIHGLGILNKRIVVLENNLLRLYPNPSDYDIPDFDDEKFMDTEGETARFREFYSFCLHENGVQKVQYIDNFTENNGDCLRVQRLAEPILFAVSESSAPSGVQMISTKDGSVDDLLEKLYYQMSLDNIEFQVAVEDSKAVEIGTLMQATHLMGIDLQLFACSQSQEVKPRQGLFDLMKRVWGYDTFRQLKMYRDLNVNHDVIEISQGAVIETVVQQAEHAYRGEPKAVHSVLLTSPTGAGKSLLFQLSAIYLAEHYGLLTIVVSPLVALMNDQVDGLTGYDGVATLNSNKTASEKEHVLRGVQEGKVNILYLSPELLLSYSITSFIGKRQLGLLVVDEAHTVTTWGRDFRVDYWFLGDYLRKARRILKYNFPIFALTATAVWSPTGKNDMVFETIRSLNMNPCIKFIGVVRRDNISFEINLSGITRQYESLRKGKTIERIREALAAGRKTIVYFPFRRTVDNIYFSDEVADIRPSLARYHAGLFPNEKASNAEDFRSGKRPIMCATKAFGMGVDVSDIQEVYHHAPTGCLSDYVQEIGRLARDPKIKGIAKIDFSPNDFRYIRKLHGLSAIKPYQLHQVLKKLMALFRINGEKRNMLISSSDFEYIFPLSQPDDVDQSLKSCLLLISNDLLNKLRFHALIVRPKSLFSKCFIEVPMQETTLFHRVNHQFLKRIKPNLFVFKADEYWAQKFANISFPQFKMKLSEGKVFKNYHVQIRNKVTLTLHASVESTYKALTEFFEQAHRFLLQMNVTHHRVDFNVMKKSLPMSYDKVKREQFLETFRLLYASPCEWSGNATTFCRIFTTNEGVLHANNSFQLMQAGYESVSDFFIQTFNNHIHDITLCTYCDAHDPIVRLCECLNSLGIADYQRLGGEQPAIFVRINNPIYLNSLARKPYYKNALLEEIYEKYQLSEKIFTYFFSTPMSDKQRWDFIEAYFLGASEEELLNFVPANS